MSSNGRGSSRGLLRDPFGTEPLADADEGLDRSLITQAPLMCASGCTRSAWLGVLGTASGTPARTLDVRCAFRPYSSTTTREGGLQWQKKTTRRSTLRIRKDYGAAGSEIDDCDCRFDRRGFGNHGHSSCTGCAYRTIGTHGRDRNYRHHSLLSRLHMSLGSRWPRPLPGIGSLLFSARERSDELIDDDS